MSCFLISGPYFSKYKILRLQYLSHLVLLQSAHAFSLEVHICHVFNEAFFSLNTRSFDNWKSVFFRFPWQPMFAKQIISSQSCNLSIQTMPEKIQPAFTCSKLTMETLEQVVKCVQSEICSTPVASFWCLYC